MRPCGGCGELYEAERYSRRCETCKETHRVSKGRRDSASRRKRAVEDPEFDRHLKSNMSRSKYGISLDERDAMLAAQGGVCLICGTDTPSGVGWVIDHDHSCCDGKRSCGKCVRGILCAKCNGLLGFCNDNVDILLSAAAYLVSRQDVLDIQRRQPAG